MAHDRRVLEQLGLRARRPRRDLRPLEKVVQQNGVNLLRSLNAKPYVLGTRRGKREKDHGTHQTPGIADVYMVLPQPMAAVVTGPEARDRCQHVHADDFMWPDLGGFRSAGWWEAKRPGEKREPDQVAFGEECLERGVPYVWGDLDALIAWLIAGGWLKRDQVGAHHLGGQS